MQLHYAPLFAIPHQLVLEAEASWELEAAPQAEGASLGQPQLKVGAALREGVAWLQLCARELPVAYLLAMVALAVMVTYELHQKGFGPCSSSAEEPPPQEGAVWTWMADPRRVQMG